MTQMYKNRKVMYGAAILLLAVVIAAIVPGLMQATSTPQYCASCHVMESQYEDWFYSGSHKQVSCVECHLPHNNFFNYYLWKGLDGMKDLLYFYTGMIPDPIQTSGHGVKTVQNNCVRCHEEMVSRISVDTINCWDCHRDNYHTMIHSR
ncbi:MAG: cytochrome c nitrite reductase small subunit [Spirochaetota bacterium]